MAYSKFTTRSVKERLGVEIIEEMSLFDPAQIVPMTPSDLLKATLSEYASLALSINTEKSRSEWIIAPVMAEVRKQHRTQVSLFSGSTFVVDKSKGLDGSCDFMLSLSREQLYIVAPILTVVEAKKEDINGGVGQCVATMFAAQLYNQREKQSVPAVYGAITTGTIWKFLKLSDTTAWLDRDEYYLNDIELLMGIFSWIISTGHQAQVTV
jgi:hypothetical protein